MAALPYPPTQNGLQKTLAAQLDQGETSSMTLNNTTGVQNKPGVVLINRVNSSGVEQSASDREWVAFTGVSGSTLTGLTRGIGGSTDQDHAVGQVVEFVFDVTQMQTIIESVAILVTEAAHTTVNTANVVTPTGTQTLTNKTLTSPVLNGSLTGTGVVDEDDMSSDSATKVPTQQSVKAYVDANAGNTDGWTDATAETWTYASATTFTIAGVDKTTQYKKGTRLKLVQSATTKYFYVRSSSFSTDTTVTVVASTEYSIANSAISGNYYSYAENPQGFPSVFTFDVTLTGFSSVSSEEFQYRISGGMLHMWIYLLGASNAATFTFDLPVAPDYGSFTPYRAHVAPVYDNSSWQAAAGAIGFVDNTATAKVGKALTSIASDAYGGFTTSNNKGTTGYYSYPI